jgi:hypothetical protein
VLDPDAKTSAWFGEAWNFFDTGVKKITSFKKNIHFSEGFVGIHIQVIPVCVSPAFSFQFEGKGVRKKAELLTEYGRKTVLGKVVMIFE